MAAEKFKSFPREMGLNGVTNPSQFIPNPFWPNVRLYTRVRGLQMLAWHKNELIIARNE